MKYLKYKDFMPSLKALHQIGGGYTRAADNVLKLIGSIKLQETNPFDGLKMTNHGENRIKHCIKYDLSEFCRLITIVNNNVTAFCFVGKHDDCEKWLKRNKGFILTINRNDEIIETFETIDVSDNNKRIKYETDFSNGYLFKKIDADIYDRICENVPRSLCQEFEKLESHYTEEDIMKLALKIKDNNISNLFYDVFTLLCNSDIKEANKRINLYLKENLRIEDIDEELIDELVAGESFIEFENFDSELIAHLMKTATFYQWMLIMHPEQKKIVDRDFTGPARLSGVSGSGKTCVVIKRAIRLAKKYDSEKILILTLNKALAKLINDLTDIACHKNRGNICVMSFWDLCCHELRIFEPNDFERKITDRTYKINEEINDIWNEFYHLENQNDDAEIFFPVIQSLISQFVDPTKYIYEELDYLRSALPSINRNKYIELNRVRRAIPLLPEYREIIISGLEKWEEKMEFVGIIDSLGIANKLYKYIDKLTPKYRCILIDESQDFGNIELEIVRKIVKEDENDIFLSGDNAQQVYSKYHIPLYAGIDIRGRSLNLKINYRNSKEILKAAFSVLEKNLPEKNFLTDEFEVLDPEYSNFSTPKPLILKGNSFKDELYSSLSFYEDKYKDKNKDSNQNKSCIVLAGLTLTETKKLGEIFNKKVLDGSIDINDDKIFFSDLEQAKGFEFDSVTIINCNKGVIPYPNLPKQEWFRELTKLYVAMTRAKQELIISYSNSISDFIKLSDVNFTFGDWREHTKYEKEKQKSVKYEKIKINNKDILLKTGREYIYTLNAIGLSKNLQDKMISLINGIEKTDEKGKKLEWRNIGEVIKSLGDIRPRFGVDTDDFFKHFDYLYRMDEKIL